MGEECTDHESRAKAALCGSGDPARDDVCARRRIHEGAIREAAQVRPKRIPATMDTICTAS